jgi:ABC-type hemin transport system substrate-binding protein
LAEVEAAQPDVVLLPSEPYPFEEQHLAIFAGLDIPAAKTGRITLVDGSLLTWHGTRMAHAFNIIPQLLCPLDEV